MCLETVLDPSQAQKNLAVEQEKGGKWDDNGGQGPDPTDVNDDVLLAPAHCGGSDHHFLFNCAVGCPNLPARREQSVENHCGISLCRDMMAKGSSLMDGGK